MFKLIVGPEMQARFNGIVQHLFAVLAEKVKMGEDCLMSSSIKDDETVDDL